jgi:hypothetical protein
MAAFGCVDFVVRGEADVTFPAFLRCLFAPLSERGGPMTATTSCWSPRPAGTGGLAGLTFRRDGEVVRNPNAPVIEDFDTLPMPAFGLDTEIATFYRVLFYDATKRFIIETTRLVGLRRSLARIFGA